MRVILHMCNKYTTKPLSFCIRLELGNPGLEASADARARATRINITHLEEDGGGMRPYSLYNSYTDLRYHMVYIYLNAQSALFEMLALALIVPGFMHCNISQISPTF